MQCIRELFSVHFTWSLDCTWLIWTKFFYKWTECNAESNFFVTKYWNAASKLKITAQSIWNNLINLVGISVQVSKPTSLRTWDQLFLKFPLMKWRELWLFFWILWLFTQQSMCQCLLEASTNSQWLIVCWHSTLPAICGIYSLRRLWQCSANSKLIFGLTGKIKYITVIRQVFLLQQQKIFLNREEFK